MARQILDWFSALLMLRLMAAVICVLLLERALAWLQRTLGGADAARTSRPRDVRRSHYRRQRSGVRRVRRPATSGACLPFDSSN